MGILATLVPVLLKYAAPLFEQFLGDKSKAADLSAQLQTLLVTQATAELQAEAQNALAQIGVEQTEAQSQNLFVSGARPAAVWICVLGLAYQFLAQPLLSWGSLNFHWISPPQLDVTTLMGLLGGLLGLGAWHVADNITKK